MGNDISRINQRGTSQADIAGKNLSPFAVWGLSFGYAVGWGAFVISSAEFLPTAGPLGTLIGIVVGALAMAVIGWNYHRMVSSDPGPGGAYSYTQKAIGADCGFLTAWSLSLAYMAILWANATALILLVRHMFGNVLQFGWHDNLAGFDIYLGEVLLSVVVMIIAGCACLWGRRLAGRIQAALALFMLSGVAVCFYFAVFRHEGGLQAMAPAFAQNGARPLTQVLGILAMIPWAFVGFEAVSNSSAEFDFNRKKLWHILVAAIAASVAMYAMLALLPVLAHPDGFATWADYLKGSRGLDGLDSMPTFAAARIVLGNGGVVLLGCTMFAAIFTGIVGATVAMSRLLYALAADNLSPKLKWLGTLDRNGTPRNAILLVVGVSLVIPFFGRTVIGWPIEVSSLGAAVAYCCTSMAAFRFASKIGDKVTKITGIVGSAMSVVFCLLLLVPNYISGNALSAEAYLVLAIWCIVGFAIYWHVFRNDERQRFGHTHIVWTGIVALIFFSSLMWVRLATQKATEQTVDSIVEFSADHCATMHGTTNHKFLHHEQEFIVGKMSSLNSSRLFHDIVQMGLLTFALVIMFSLYAIHRRRLEVLKIAKAMADERDRAKSLFFSTVSHDIRTPLNSIICFSEMLQQGFDTKTEHDLAVNSIQQSSTMLLQLVNDLLDLTKLEAGRMDIHVEPTDVARLLRQIAASFGTTHQKPGLEFLCRSNDTPPLMLDPHRLQQIAFNFMGNAIKFTKKGFIEIRVSFQPDESGTSGVFRMEVQDTGCGISEADMKKLASPFVQVGHVSTQRAGTGLGLHICRLLARAMGGDLEISSVLGKGSTFSIVVPGVKKAESEESKVKNEKLRVKSGESGNANPPQLSTLNSKLSTHRILIADDTKMNQIVLRTMFGRLGVTDITYADNGREALEILTAPDAPTFDFVLTDAWMPEMTGMELVAEIRANPALADMPVYLFTAEVEMQDTYAENGFNDILLKPANLEALKKLLA